MNILRKTILKYLKTINDLLRVTLGVLAVIVVLAAAYLTYRLNNYGTNDTAINFIEYLLNNPLLPFEGIVLGLLIPFLLVTAHQVINDYYDYESDKKNNRFDRPIVRGDISRNGARNIAYSFYVISTLITIYEIVAYGIDPMLLVIVLFFIPWGISYNLGVKRLGLLGNIWVSIGYVAPFFFGPYIIKMKNDWVFFSIVLLCGYVFFSAVGREILKDIMDMEGDKQIGMRSAAIVFGPKVAAMLSTGSFLLTIILGIVLIFRCFSTNIVFIGGMVLLAIVLLYSSYIMLTTNDYLQTGIKARKYTRWSLWIATIAVFGSTFFIP